MSFSTTIRVPAGKVTANLSGFPLVFDLATLGNDFWTQVASDGGDIRVADVNGTRPFDVIWIDTVNRTGRLVFLAATVTAATASEWTLTAGTSDTMPAATDPIGRNAVWAGYSFVSWFVGNLQDRTGNHTLSVETGTPAYLSPHGLDITADLRLTAAGLSGSNIFTFGARGTFSNITSNRSILAWLETLGSNAGRSALGSRASSGLYSNWDNLNSWNDGAPASLNVPVHLHGVWNGSTAKQLFVNGELSATDAPASAIGSSNDTLVIAEGGAGTSFHRGSILVAYLRPSAVSAAWAAAEAANFADPAAFFRVDVIWHWLGAPRTDGVACVARLNATASVEIEASLSASFTSPIVGSAVVGEAVRAEITGLAADTLYHYRLRVDGVPQAAAFTFRTLPASPASFVCALSGDASTGSNASVFATILAQAPNFFLHLGDAHYENIATDSPALFEAAYDDVLAAPNQAELYRRVPIVYTWDDHDFGPNDSDLTAPGRDAACVAYRSRVPHFPLVDAAPSGPIYHSFDVGRVRFIVTDLRSEAAPRTNPDNRAKSMLGCAQRQWFRELLANSAGKLLVWVNSRVWGGVPTVSAGHWGGFTAERAEIAGWIHQHCPGRLIVLSADMHALAIDNGSNHDFLSGGGEPIPTFQAAPLDRTPNLYGGATYSEGIFSGNGQFGVMEVTDTGGAAVTVDWRGYNAAGSVLVSHQFSVPL